MEELYEEGVANHLGPESCGRGRKAVLEALTGESAGWVLSRDSFWSRVPTYSSHREGNIVSAANARQRGARRGQRPQARTETSRTEVGRSRGWPWKDAPRVRARNHRVSVR